MHRKFLPALGIIVATVILVAINELIELTFVKDYALMLIIGGMLFGVWLTKLSDKSNNLK